MRLTLILLFSFFFITHSLAQKKVDNNVNALYFNFTGAYQLPQGDMADRFGNTPNIGLQAEWMQANTNLIFGLYGSFSYGDKVKEDVAAMFRTPYGPVIGIDQTATILNFKERVFNYGFHFGKLFPVNRSKNTRAGIRATLGVGQMRHWILISDKFNSANQFKGEYRKGYDRLTAGLTFTPFIGYQYTSLNRYLNILAGVEYVAGFTKSQRSWDYDRFSQDTKKRFDGLLGFRLGFSLPLFFGDSDVDVEY